MVDITEEIADLDLKTMYLVKFCEKLEAKIEMMHLDSLQGKCTPLDNLTLCDSIHAAVDNATCVIRTALLKLEGEHE